MIASQNGHVDVVNVLLQHGASIHLMNKVKIQMFCINLGDIRTVHILLYNLSFHDNISALLTE